MEPRLDFWQATPELMQGFMALNTQIEAAGIEPTLMHLIKLRASQINGCAFCIEMHTREARSHGEAESRLHLVAAWRDSYVFTDREKLGLNWAEALTRLGDARPDDALYAKVVTEFGETETVALTAVVTMINTWNRLCIAFDAVHRKPEDLVA